MIITLYTRQGCHLCEAAEAVIRDVAAARPDVQLRTVDIDADPALTDRYSVRVPVVAVDGVEIAEYEVTREALIAALDGSPSQPSLQSRDNPRSLLRRLLKLGRDTP